MLSKTIKVSKGDYDFLHLISKRMNINLGEALHMCLNFKKSSTEERFLARQLSKIRAELTLETVAKVVRGEQTAVKLGLIDRLHKIWHK